MWPELPDKIRDRDADVWEPLLTLAEIAGGEWPILARVAAVTLVTLAKESTPSLGVKLLADIQQVLKREEQMKTSELLEKLAAVEESPWGDLKGKPLDDRGLARRLSPYGIKPTTIRTWSGTAKGYRRSDFHDAWLRYLSPLGSSPEASVTSVTSGTVAA
jgi:hypothetical protein